MNPEQARIAALEVELARLVAEDSPHSQRIGAALKVYIDKLKASPQTSEYASL